MRHGRGFTVVELLVVIALVVAALALLLPTIAKPRQTACRVLCSNNLRQIGLAIDMYRRENGGHYPRTISSDTSPLRLDSGGADDANPFTEAASTHMGANNVPASLFLLLRTEGLSAEVFTCPSSSSSKDRMNGMSADQRSNFSDVHENLSYGYAIPFSLGVAGYELGAKTPADFAVAADRAPGLGVSGVTQANDPVARQRLANSTNHSGDGQYILYADGRVVFERTPFAGVDGNNIYLGDTAGPRGKNERVYPNTTDARSQKPTSPSDSVIVPWDQDNRISAWNAPEPGTPVPAN